MSVFAGKSYFRLLIPALSAMLLLAGCLKKETAVQPYDRGGLSSATIYMGPDYDNQIFYSLKNSRISGQTNKADWDLALSSDPAENEIWLNGARFMKAGRLNALNGDITRSPGDTAGIHKQMRVDLAGHLPGQSAIGRWQDSTPVYLIDLGIDPNGKRLGVLKVRFVRRTATAYTLRVAGLNEAVFREVDVPVMSGTWQTLVNLRTLTTIADVPQRDAFELWFTGYTFNFDNPPEDYLVTGVLVPYGTRVVRIKDKDFREVSAADTMGRPVQTAGDAIGYDWKVYDFNTSRYTVDTKSTFIIKSAAGYIYKMRFVSFYSPTNQRGYPVFEYALL